MIDYAALHQSGAPLEPAPQDSRDYVLGSLAADNVTAPYASDQSRQPHDFEQKQFEDYVKSQAYSDCVGNSAANKAELFLALRGIKRQFSPLYPYFNGRNVLASILG